jgi:hypothetical protein
LQSAGVNKATTDGWRGFSGKLFFLILDKSLRHFYEHFLLSQSADKSPENKTLVLVLCLPDFTENFNVIPFFKLILLFVGDVIATCWQAKPI